MRKTLCSDFGFTLVGTKPISYDDFLKEPFTENDEDRLAYIAYLQSFFSPSTRFVLLLDKRFDRICGAFLIDKKSCQKLGFTEQEPLRFETERIGELFGYGKHNAAFYMRWAELGKYLRKFEKWGPQRPKDLRAVKQRMRFSSWDIPYRIEAPRLGMGFVSLEEEWNYLNSLKNPFVYRKPPFMIQLPIFVSKKGKETDEIVEKMQKAANELGKMLQDSQWIDLVKEHLKDQ